MVFFINYFNWLDFLCGSLVSGCFGCILGVGAFLDIQRKGRFLND